MPRWACVLLVLSVAGLLLLLYCSLLLRPSPEMLLHRFCYKRKSLLAAECHPYIDSELDGEISRREHFVGELFRAYKDDGSTYRLATRPFASSRSAIEEHDLYRLVRQMPKGTALRVHDIGMCDVRTLLDFTYFPQLWVCIGREEGSYELVRFSSATPSDEGKRCEWKPLEVERQQRGFAEVDQALVQRMTIDWETVQHMDNASVVQLHIDSRVDFIRDLVTFAPVWREYIYKSIEQFHEDGLLYMEIRTTFPQLYDLHGPRYPPIQSAKVIHQQAHNFIKGHRNFLGVRLIYEPTPDLDGCQFLGYARNYTEFKCILGEFLVGFGWSTTDESAHQISPHALHIIEQQPDMQFFFSAGKTNWLFSGEDRNVGDALLLGAKRLGGGYILAKHKYMRKYGKMMDIPVEVTPISDQMFGLVVDMRNHAASYLVTQNYPLVIGSDYPGLWGAKPASHDMFLAYMGIAHGQQDLRFLKEIAMNSIKYSALTSVYREWAMLIFESQWSQWIDKQSKFMLENEELVPVPV